MRQSADHKIKGEPMEIVATTSLRITIVAPPQVYAGCPVLGFFKGGSDTTDTTFVRFVMLTFRLPLFAKMRKGRGTRDSECGMKIKRVEGSATRR